MKIHVDKIPQEGLELIEQIEPQRLSLDLERQGVNFTKTIDVKANVSKIGGEVFVKIDLAAPVEYTCARCLAKVQDVFKKHFDTSHEAKDGDILEIDEGIRQEMILDYPIKVVCRPGCKGLCPNCGQNLNVAKCDCMTEDRGQRTDVRKI